MVLLWIAIACFVYWQHERYVTTRKQRNSAIKLLLAAVQEDKTNTWANLYPTILNSSKHFSPAQIASDLDCTVDELKYTTAVMKEIVELRNGRPGSMNVYKSKHWLDPA